MYMIIRMFITSHMAACRSHMQDLKEITEAVLYENYRIETVRHACMYDLVIQRQSTVLGRVHSLAAAKAHHSAQNMCRMRLYD